MVRRCRIMIIFVLELVRQTERIQLKEINLMIAI